MLQRLLLLYRSSCVHLFTFPAGSSVDHREPGSMSASSPARNSTGSARWPASVIGMSALSLLTLASGCAVDAAERASPITHGSAISGHVDWKETIRLEESDAVVNVLISVTIDPEGGYLVADEAEGQIRRYRADGDLVNYFGRKGRGPGEFVALHRVMRLSSGDILALDIVHTGVVFDRVGETVRRTFRTPVGPLHHASLVSDTVLLLGGALRGERSTDDSTRLHLWSLTGDSLLTSFFPRPTGGSAYEMAANTGGFVSAAIRGDTVVATFALSDTLYFFDLAGRSLGRTPLPLQHFRRITHKHPTLDRQAGLDAARAWAGTFSLISDVFWLNDGTFLIQYQDRVGRTPRWRLAAFTRDLTPIFEVLDSPHLLAADAQTRALYFVSPESEVPSEWKRGVLSH